MARKSIIKQYAEALGRADLNGLEVLAFQFPSENAQQDAHYDMMMGGHRYELYDAQRSQAYIVIQPKCADVIREWAQIHGGKEFDYRNTLLY